MLFTTIYSVYFYKYVHGHNSADELALWHLWFTSSISRYRHHVPRETMQNPGNDAHADRLSPRKLYQLRILDLFLTLDASCAFLSWHLLGRNLAVFHCIRTNSGHTFIRREYNPRRYGEALHRLSTGRSWVHTLCGKNVTFPVWGHI